MTLRSARNDRPKAHGNERTQHMTVLIKPRRPFHMGSSAGGRPGSCAIYAKRLSRVNKGESPLLVLGGFRPLIISFRRLARPTICHNKSRTLGYGTDQNSL